MTCCAATKTKASRHGERIALRDRIRPIYNLQMEDSVIADLTEKFEANSTQKNGIEVCFETEFKEMTGALGEFFIGERMFKVILQLSRNMEMEAS